MPKSKKRLYKTFTALAAAFKSGELDPKKYYIMVDKGGSELSLSYRYQDADSEEENERRQDECGDWFVCPDDEDPPIMHLMREMGIPNEWC